MKRTLILVVGLSVAGAVLAQAQIIDGSRRSRDPIAWTSLSIGWFHQNGFCDADSQACWDFASAPQWRGTLGVPLGRGATIGVAASTARVPLIYNGFAGGAIATNTCGGCDADANVTQYFGNLHIGNGSGFQQVIDLNAGMTVFSNFRTSSGGTRLGGKAASNFTFALGYGFGYSFTPRAQIMVLQEYGLVILKRQTGSSNNTAQQTNLRIGFKYGLGN